MIINTSGIFFQNLKENWNDFFVTKNIVDLFY